MASSRRRSSSARRRVRSASRSASRCLASSSASNSARSANSSAATSRAAASASASCSWATTAIRSWGSRDDRARCQFRARELNSATDGAGRAAEETGVRVATTNSMVSIRDASAKGRVAASAVPVSAPGDDGFSSTKSGSAATVAKATTTTRHRSTVGSASRAPSPSPPDTTGPGPYRRRDDRDGGRSVQDRRAIS